MARRKLQQERVLGPYPDNHGGWKLVHVNRGGAKSTKVFATEAEAERAVKALRRELGLLSGKMLDQALDDYEQYMQQEKGNEPKSATETMRRLRRFFPDQNLLLSEVDQGDAHGYYDAMRKWVKPNGQPISVDYHRNTLAEARSFFKWCLVKKKWREKNPFDGVEGVGKRKHGKEQLRIDEARKWLAKAIEFADAGDDGAIAAMVALLLGTRASEVVSRVARDVDDAGKLFWIPDAKTNAGRRRVQVPKLLRPYLLELAEGKQPGDLLFGYHCPDWVGDWVRRICTAAELPIVTAHGMRGLHSSIAVEAGVTAHVVA